MFRINNAQNAIRVLGKTLRLNEHGFYSKFAEECDAVA